MGRLVNIDINYPIIAPNAAAHVRVTFPLRCFKAKPSDHTSIPRAGSPVSPVSNKSNTNEASSSASGPRNLPMAVKRELAAKDREIARLSAKLREIEGDRAAGRASTARNIDSSSEAAPLGGRDEPDRTGAAECPGEGDEGEGAIAHDQGGAEDPLVLQLESLLAGRERMTKELYELRRENAALHEVLAHAMAALRRQGIDESAQGMGSEAGAAEGSGAEREEGEVGGVGGVSGCVVEEMGFSESEWEESVADSEWEGERRDRK